jgi:hypothetical protein
MKYTKNIFLMLSVLIVFGTSCSKKFLTNLNVNPNAADNVPPNVLLSTVEAALGYTQGGDLSRFTSLMTQQTFGFTAQPQQYYTYGFNPGTFDNLWPNLYTSVMENDYTLIHISDAAGDNVYSGISRMLMAYSLQITVDTWGKIPYSQAFQGNVPGGTTTPVYDDDKALYDTITSLINVGTGQLSDPTKAGPLTPGADDVIYGGDAAEWIKFGHAIKARLAIHQSKGDAAMATTALTEIASSFSSNSDNAQYIFGVDQTSANPWYQFGRDRTANITFSTSFLANQLLTLHDPRFPIYIDSANDQNGPDPTGDHYGGLAHYYGSISAPVEFITYDELLFVSAEATLRATGSISDAQVLYQAAIRANMQKLGVAATDATTYIAANGTLPASVDAAIAQVAYQEYLALYLNPEAWTTWRRTASPGITPTIGSAIPRRLLYPQSEINYNPANVPTSTLFSPKVFWDN